MSLPIIINWGLPISLLSPVGNLLFTPFVTIFLLLASLIFFCELFFIPNGLFIHALELLYMCWLSIMRLIPFNPLVGFPKPNAFLLLGIPFVTISLLTIPSMRSIYRSIGCMIALFILFYFYVNCIQHPNKIISTLNCNRGQVTILYDHGTLVIIDPGVIGQAKSAYSWLAYTLLPYVTSTTGKTTIDYLILLQPTKTILTALCDLLMEVQIGTIMIPELKIHKSDSTLHMYKQLQQRANKTCTKVIIIDSESQKIQFNQTTITLTPHQWITGNNFLIRNVQVIGSLENQSFTCLPYKEDKRKKKISKC
ncbi:hypothetical protein E3J79_01040 [Candidatus Dependentiae bacterium]|nr:MAG: hypothetical protein E3J79_01040 [Candidatus Dependentiae bacterium]